MTKQTSVIEPVTGNQVKMVPLDPMEALPGPENLIRLAIEQKVPVETLERLLVMRTQLKAEDARSAFYGALAAFQRACPTIPKNRVVFNRDNKTVRYRYASFEDIVQAIGPQLEANGLSYRFDSELAQGKYTCKCVITHLEGHSEASGFTVPIEASGNMNAIQEHGAAATYAKRYALCNALGILTGDEDTDANADSKPPPAPKPEPKPEPAKPKEDPAVALVARIRSLCVSHDNEQWLVAWLRDGITNKKTGRSIKWLDHDAGLDKLRLDRLKYLVDKWPEVSEAVDAFAKQNMDVAH